MNDEIMNTDCLPIITGMQEQSIDVVITDPPYPSPTGLFAESYIDGIAALYLCAKKAKKHVVFFWSPLVEPPRPPPGWFHTATHIWHKPDGKTSITYELVIAWSKDYHRQPHKVWSIPILDYRTLRDWNKQHPTQKPLRLLRYIVEDYSEEGDLVLDPFAGTGTTLVAAKQLKRHYLGMETNKEFAEFATQRLQPREEKSNDAPPESSTQLEQPKTKPRTKR
ncbi:MAG: site-specific DNA-methyltransferase [Bryobacteraceae bacterium]|nr:site-specific DNA-methyltransferase [Bryobacteraceae bacterium]